MRLCLDTNILIDVLKGEAIALAWLEQQHRPAISLITWMEVLVGCQPEEAPVVQQWLESFDRLPVDHAVAELASARCGKRLLATRIIKVFPLRLGGVLHPYEL